MHTTKQQLAIVTKLSNSKLKHRKCVQSWPKHVRPVHASRRLTESRFSFELSVWLLSS
jgi:hypothetical protein